MKTNSILTMGLMMVASLWLLTACDDGSSKSNKDDSDTGANASDTSDDTLVGSCEADKAECLSDSVGRVCPSDGYGWVSFTCADDEACVDGACTKTGDTLCEAEEVVCATDKSYKTCDNDGSGWILSACAANETCTEGECVLDTEAGTCTPQERTCMSDSVALTCNDNGSGYVVTDCPDGTACSDGACMGSVCEVGATRCDTLSITSIIGESSFNPMVLFKCVDGSGWVEELCAAGELCSEGADLQSAQVYGDSLFLWYLSEGELPFPSPVDIPSSAVASCQKSDCVNDSAMFALMGGMRPRAKIGSEASKECNDALNGYRSCEGMPPYSAMKYVDYACPTGTSCKSLSEPRDIKLSVSSEVMCVPECMPGQTKCGTSDGQEGISTCQADGTWGTTVPCEAPTSQCARNLSTVFNQVATCVNPVCAATPDEGMVAGVCQTDTTILACDAAGNLAADATDCPGLCRDINVIVNDARVGVCAREECITGARECVSDTNLYKECVDGYWTTTYQSCGIDQACIDTSGNNYSDIVCGECIAGQTRCEEGSIATCKADNTWGDPVNCSYGVCAGSSTNAYCNAECLPGEVKCYSISTEQSCTEQGLWDEPTACADDKYCLLNRYSDHLGCVECAGSNEGNYAWKITDASCTMNGELKICGPDNNWLDPTACDTNTFCSGKELYGSSTSWSRTATCSTGPE